MASELSALAGITSDAKRLAERVFGLKDASVEQRLRARIVLAQVRIDAGRAREAHQHLREIVNDAAAAKAWQIRCWAELWSLTALGDSGSAGEIRGFLRHLRQHVNQLGNPATSIALHLFVAEAESRRGVIASSVEHVKIARSLLQTFPNYWLEALAAIDALCLAVMRIGPRNSNEGGEGCAEGGLRGWRREGKAGGNLEFRHARSCSGKSGGRGEAIQGGATPL